MLGIPSGGGGCAAHVPLRCREGTKSLSECNKCIDVNPALVCKRRAQTCLEARKTSLRRLQNPPWECPGASREPKMHPSVPKRCPRAPKTRPRSTQEAPNRRSREPKRRPRESQTPPKWSPGGPRPEKFNGFSHPCKKPAFTEASASIFACFVMFFKPSTS